MLVVKVEVWPGGDFDRAFEISRIGIANVSGLRQYSDYEVTAMMGRDRDEQVMRVEVKNHHRDAGWVPLVRRTMTGIFLREELGRVVPYDDPVAERMRKGHRV
jgi:hypothetical protein